MRGTALPAPWWALGAVLALAATGCRGGAPGSSPSPGPGRADAGAGPVSEDEVLARSSGQSAIDNPEQARLVDRALCRRSGCCVVSIEDAGRDRKGRTLVVAETALDGADCLIPRPRVPQPFGAGRLDLAPSPLQKLPRPDPEPAAGDDRREGTEDPSEEGAVADESDDGCRVFNHDLVVIDKRQVRERYALSSECDEGGPVNFHMEHGMEVDSKERTFSHSHNGTKGLSSWGSGVTVGLDPVRVIGRYQFTDSSSVNIDWDLLQRRESRTVPDEEARAQLDAARPADGGGPGEEGEDGEDEGPTVQLSSIAVPKVALPAAFTAGGWKVTGLGSCGVLLDGKDSGSTLYGEANAADATLRVVASTEGVLFVEVTDDRWTGPSRSWVKDDHLELWLAREPPPPGAGDGPAADPAKPKGTAVQWGIRIADGATFPAFGAPQPLTGVEVVRRGSVARLKIPFAAGEHAAFAVVYSDGDDGKTQERLIATASLTRGDGTTLGGTWAVDPRDAACALKGKALTVLRPPPPRDSPLGDPEKELE